MDSFVQTSSSKHMYHEEQHEETLRQEMSSQCEYDEEEEETECISSPTDEHTQSVAGGEVLALVEKIFLSNFIVPRILDRQSFPSILKRLVIFGRVMRSNPSTSHKTQFWLSCLPFPLFQCHKKTNGLIFYMIWFPLNKCHFFPINNTHTH